MQKEDGWNANEAARCRRSRSCHGLEGARLQGYIVVGGHDVRTPRPMLHLSDQISILPATPAQSDQPPRCELRIDGRATGLCLSGVVLEAALRCDAGWLLFLTDDVPFEDMLSIHLLNPAGTLRLDSARIGSAYATGNFRALRIQPPDTLAFHFMGGTPWSVQLLAVPAWRLPFVGEPAGVHRPFGFLRRFVVRGAPRPAPR
jgi:hypothetical protein